MSVLVYYVSNINKKSIIDPFTTDYIPREGEHIVLNCEEYIVVGVLYFPIQKYANVYCRKATGNDVTFFK